MYTWINNRLRPEVFSLCYLNNGHTQERSEYPKVPNSGMAPSAADTLTKWRYSLRYAFEPPIQPNLLTPACFKHSRKGNQKTEIW